MRYVYRLEHKDSGYGVWNGGYVYQCPSYTEKFSLTQERHPEPTADLKLSRAWKDLPDRRLYFFGFESIEQYRDWFYLPEFRKELAACGVVLRCYEVHPNDLVEGSQQIIFQRDRARAVSEMPADFI